MMKIENDNESEKNHSDERNNYSGNLLLDIDIFFSCQRTRDLDDDVPELTLYLKFPSFLRPKKSEHLSLSIRVTSGCKRRLGYSSPSVTEDHVVIFTCPPRIATPICWETKCYVFSDPFLQPSVFAAQIIQRVCNGQGTLFCHFSVHG